MNRRRLASLLIVLLIALMLPSSALAAVAERGGRRLHVAEDSVDSTLDVLGNDNIGNVGPAVATVNVSTPSGMARARPWD